ncbi:hypothetical protein [Paeniglutamicibacter psychrophenolicus]|uniref:Uncharacterized protein n=1 Tax=Paeniglutamicibacter psychrophenolicus TaxID=257454 RepID=A0ABS4WAX0_9MICC|nr:hypothetical protein [Paeniglutamicibacter psychrophenolicus]MBP2373337.1 hypothetical protein [Paeniglutamicibacter psychrophenolicus]
MNPEQFGAQNVWLLLDQFNDLLGKARTKDASTSDNAMKLNVHR